MEQSSGPLACVRIGASAARRSLQRVTHTLYHETFVLFYFSVLYANNLLHCCANTLVALEEAVVLSLEKVSFLMRKECEKKRGRETHP